jgi:phage shock protein PspC (stress-responsive transcriptional regulator)
MLSLRANWHAGCKEDGMSNLTLMPKELNMTNQTPLPLRHDTILGVCEAIGQDFGFNPNWLRLAFIPPMFVSVTATVAAYLALGAVVAATRYFAPNKPASQQVVDVTAVEVVDEELAIAA